MQSIFNHLQHLILHHHLWGIMLKLKVLTVLQFSFLTLLDSLSWVLPQHLLKWLIFSMICIHVLMELWSTMMSIRFVFKINRINFVTKSKNCYWSILPKLLPLSKRAFLFGLPQVSSQIFVITLFPLRAKKSNFWQ